MSSSDKFGLGRRGSGDAARLCILLSVDGRMRCASDPVVRGLLARVCNLAGEVRSIFQFIQCQSHLRARVSGLSQDHPGGSILDVVCHLSPVESPCWLGQM